VEFIALAVAHKAVNLGQGFIDYEPPEYFLDIYSETVNERSVFLHQYTRGFVSSIRI
jgi:kynurenine--oxoglutarate transaminase/cysteine-S-conjugate beta-lyase/glutamine--phenylpyruvate transaminase